MAEKTYPNLSALAASSGFDIKALLAALWAKYGPVLGTLVVDALELLLGQLVPHATLAAATCPSGDCTAIVAHLDQIIQNAVCDLNCALCAKAMCCDDNCQVKKG